MAEPERLPTASAAPPALNGRSSGAPAWLAVRDLQVAYRLPDGRELPALHGLSFDLARGETLGVVGEAGSGKTTLLLALLGLLPTARVSGSVFFAGGPLPLGDEQRLRAFRWRRIALAFQGSATAFNPVYPVGAQVVEPLVEHLGLDGGTARARALALWERVGLRPELFDRYPHQLSGGEKQRALLAMALACEPELLLVDEPTSGLDALAKAQALDLLRTLQRQRGFGLIVVSHDLGDVRRLATQVLVLYAGRAVEYGSADLVLADPRHPYSVGLVGAYPTLSRARDLWGIRGAPPDPLHPPPGCVFHPRCTQTVERCRTETPRLTEWHGRWIACHLGGTQVLLAARGLQKTFHLPGGAPVAAVQDATFEVREGEVVALVGPSGSGKSTIARLLVGLVPPDAGTVLLEGQDLGALRGPALTAARRRIQLIFQDPFDALSPRLTVLELVREPLDLAGGLAGSPAHPGARWGALERAERDARARAALAAVRLPTTPEFLARHAHELSGGQAQRVALARALVVEPKIIVADEPVAQLDVSEQAHVIRLLKELQNERGLGLLLISHDLALVRKVADRIVVLHAGRVVESGPADRVVTAPAHPVTRALLAAGRAAPAALG